MAGVAMPASKSNLSDQDSSPAAGCARGLVALNEGSQQHCSWLHADILPHWCSKVRWCAVLC